MTRHPAGGHVGTAMLPDRNNVYGTLRAPTGLGQVRDAAEKVGGWESARVYTSGYDGAQTMRLSAAGAEFETTPAGEIEHLISGAVAGTLDEVIVFVGRVSRALADAGIDHGFEVYDRDGNLVFEIVPGAG